MMDDDSASRRWSRDRGRGAGRVRGREVMDRYGTITELWVREIFRRGSAGFGISIFDQQNWGFLSELGGVLGVFGNGPFTAHGAEVSGSSRFSSCTIGAVIEETHHPSSSLETTSLCRRRAHRTLLYHPPSSTNHRKLMCWRPPPSALFSLAVMRAPSSSKPYLSSQRIPRCEDSLWR